MGKAAGVVFLIALLASGISSSVVGTMAGQVVMQGFVGFRIPLWLRRLVTMTPAVLVVQSGVDLTQALVVSQVILSFVLPLPAITVSALEQPFDHRRLAEHPRGHRQPIAAGCAIVVLNALLLRSFLPRAAAARSCEAGLPHNRTCGAYAEVPHAAAGRKVRTTAAGATMMSDDVARNMLSGQGQAPGRSEPLLDRIPMLIEEDFGKKRERAQGHVAPPPVEAQAPPLPLRQITRRTRASCGARAAARSPKGGGLRRPLRGQLGTPTVLPAGTRGWAGSFGRS